VAFHASIARSLIAAGILALGGCASDWAAKESVSDLRPVYTANGRMQLQVQTCIDRTGYAKRDLGREATDALVEKLKAVPEFELKADGRYVVSCDISAFVEGSAFKRWLMPGWGATTGQVAVMVADSATGETIAILRGNATVASGGLYTVGADEVILSSALDDVVKQMRQLVAGASPIK
jgi:hypothetical protein